MQILNSTRHGLRALVLSCALSPLLCAAQPAEAWAGTDRVGNGPSSIRVTTQSGGLIQIAFGAPRSCRIEARPTIVDGAFRSFDVTSASGGSFCNRLYPGIATLQEEGGSTLLTVDTDGYRLSAPLLPLDASSFKDGPGTRWEGLVHGGARPVTMQLDLKGGAPGDTRSTLRYGSPRSCTANLAFEGTVGQVQWYSVRPGNGGSACDRLATHRLQVAPVSTGLALQFEGDVSECVLGCLLQKR